MLVAFPFHLGNFLTVKQLFHFGPRFSFPLMVHQDQKCCLFFCYSLLVLSHSVGHELSWIVFLIHGHHVLLLYLNSSHEILTLH